MRAYRKQTRKRRSIQMEAKGYRQEGIISDVKQHSLAAEAGIQPGEHLCAVNGLPVRDILDVSFAAADTDVTLTIRGTDGILRNVSLSKDPDEELGLSFEQAVFDRICLCHNKCVFCFVDRMIPGLRKTLYVRDDDYRLSFLYGNFVTLTNLTDDDYRRIIMTHMSPLYVSVHATDSAVREKMMFNRRAGSLMQDLQRLFDAGIHIHAQIVCCPGWNDGAVLEKSYRDLLARADCVEDMAVVPVGITRNTENLPDLRTFTPEEARQLVDTVTAWQEECRRRLGRTFICLGDEFYILAGRPLPPADCYDGFPQLENGIGLTRNFTEEWDAAERRSTDGRMPAVKNYAVPVGVSAYGQLRPYLDAFNRRYGTDHVLVPVVNDFFGHTINVTGLLTGTDILHAVPEDRPVILPGPVLNADSLFLDGMPLAEFRRRAGRTVHIARGAAELHSLLLREEREWTDGHTAPGRTLPDRTREDAPNPTEYVRVFP
ncbi:MAG TPA: DUF512 domain-containing protein [Acidaminococcaceae bacterium]|nr:DUF512 domain-containing protein [Acidaminococcaceae bacterium]